MARTKISPPALPRSSKGPHRPSTLNSEQVPARLVNEHATKAVTRGYWANLAYTLGGSLNDGYLSAIETLVSLFGLPPSQFNAVSAKITALIELVHNALMHRGVQAYEFSYCPPTLTAYKVAYFRLLRLLSQRRRDLDDTLQERVQRLLLPLSPSFQLHTGAGPSRGFGTSTHLPRGSAKAPTLDQPPFAPDAGTCGEREFEPQQTQMPPPPVNWRDAHFQVTSKTPSALPPVPQLWTRDEGLRALAHLTKRTHKGDADHKPVKRRRTSTSGSHRKIGFRVVAVAPDGDQENATPNPPRPEDSAAEQPHCVIRPPPRRFGIFCTGKSSMHGPSPMAWRQRPIAVRPVD